MRCYYCYNSLSSVYHSQLCRVSPFSFLVSFDIFYIRLVCDYCHKGGLITFHLNRR
jgi:hypothetical protein